MRGLVLLRLLALLLFVIGPPVAPGMISGGPAALAGDDDDGDRDDDGDDGGDDDDNNQGQNQGNTNLTPIADYRVVVTCESGDAASTTICSFTPLVPEGGKKVNHFLVPDEVACAGVAGGNGDFVDPDPNVRVTGYRFTGNGPYTLEFEGTVRTGHSLATYWVKAASDVLPATGPALTCDAAATLDEATPGPGKDSPPAATTGTVVIEIHACTGATSESTGFDWYGECPTDATDHRFLLSAVGQATTPLLAASTGDSGAATSHPVPTTSRMPMTAGARPNPTTSTPRRTSSSKPVPSPPSGSSTASSHVTGWMIACSVWKWRPLPGSFMGQAGST